MLQMISVSDKCSFELSIQTILKKNHLVL